jgi:hypothetical protein
MPPITVPTVAPTATARTRQTIATAPNRCSYMGNPLHAWKRVSAPAFSLALRLPDGSVYRRVCQWLRRTRNRSGAFRRTSGAPRDMRVTRRYGSGGNRSAVCGDSRVGSDFRADDFGPLARALNVAKPTRPRCQSPSESRGLARRFGGQQYCSPHGRGESERGRGRLACTTRFWRSPWRPFCGFWRTGIFSPAAYSSA